MSDVVLESECPECAYSAGAAKRLRARLTCRCGAQYVPVPPSHERLLAGLLSDAELLARWGPYYQGSAQDIDRTRRAPSDDSDEYAQQRRDEQREFERGRARELFVRLERLRGEAARTRGPEIARAVACITWLIERCGSERTRGVRVGGEVTAPKLSRLVGEAFADAATKARAKAAPAVLRRAPSDAPPVPPPELQLSPEPHPAMSEREIIDALSLRAQERASHRALVDRYVVAGLAWLLARAPTVMRERERTRSAAEIRSDAESARLAIEEHGAELLKDAAWLWSEGR